MPPTHERRSETFLTSPDETGERLDLFLSRRLGRSRSSVKRIIHEGRVRVGGEVEAVAARRVGRGERVEVLVEEEGLVEEEIPVPILYEDEHVLVVDKPAGLVVHPGAGNASGTLVNALVGRGISGGEDPVRPGIVHRLDRDTSGVMVVAKGEPAFSRLVRMMSEREVRRVYRAVVVGEGLPQTGTVDSPVGRDPDRPTLMTAGVGRAAVTNFRTLREGGGHAMLEVHPVTGRTHQIRVHLSAIGHPVYADPLYGAAVPGRRLWLHAEKLGFEHPVSGERLYFVAPPPEDLRLAAAELGLL